MNPRLFCLTERISWTLFCTLNSPLYERRHTTICCIPTSYVTIPKILHAGTVIRVPAVVMKSSQ